ncbi:MAG: hypothetical protein Q8R35_02095 [bacterium]|nr:hypothetical protein [bacterium]
MNAMLRRALRRNVGLRHQLERNIIGDDGDRWEEELKKFLRREPCWVPRFPVVPADGEVFELTLDGDVTNPLHMVGQDGYANWREWGFEGPRLIGRQTCYFRLVSVDSDDLVEIERVVERAGHKLALGQWREAFRLQYPFPSYSCGPIGFAGSRWMMSGLSFPCLLNSGKMIWVSTFVLTAKRDFDRWRWLVQVSK